MKNNLMLSGIVYKTPIHKVSPSGIPHCQFILAHHSIQQEAGFSRRAWCHLPVVISGRYNIDITRIVKLGAQIIVQGFISSHKIRNGFNKIVLHSTKIDLINIGD